MDEGTLEKRSEANVVLRIAFRLISICILVWVCQLERRLSEAGVWVFSSGLLLSIPARFANSVRTRDGFFGASAALLALGLILFFLRR